jgi:hypothetical protein
MEAKHEAREVSAYRTYISGRFFLFQYVSAKCDRNTARAGG